MSMFDSVADFHAAFGQLVAKVPQLPNQDIRDLRIRLLQEEFDEYKDAVAATNIIEVADALTDMAYIICGTAVSYGIVPNKGDMLFTLPLDDRRAEASFPDNDIVSAATRFLQGSFDKYVESELSDNLENIDITLQALLFFVATAAKWFNFSLFDVFNEVHRSNMSKLGEDGKPIYREDGKVMKGPKYFKPDIARIIHV